MASVRQIDFVEKCEIPKVIVRSQAAICLADVDNDEGNELIVAQYSDLENEGLEDKVARIVIYKGAAMKPLVRLEDMGMVTCLAVGDMCNMGRNYLLVCCAQGQAYIVEVVGAQLDASGKQISPAQSFVRLSSKVCLNPKFILIEDVGRSGSKEVVIASSDRCVYLFKMTLNEIRLVQKWQLASQIGSITTHEDTCRNLSILASQQGGTYVSLCILGRGKVRDDEKDVVFHQVTHSNPDRRSSSSTEMVGGVRRSKNSDVPPYCALCTLDGTLMLLEGETDKQIWSLNVNHQLFGLTKLDLTHDDAEEVILSSWDGLSYIVNHHKEVVKFQFPSPCHCFHAGFFALDAEKCVNLPVLVYVTFDHRLVMYTGISLTGIPAFSILQEVRRDSKLAESVAQLCLRTGVPERTLIKLLLYDYHQFKRSFRSLPPSS